MTESKTTTRPWQALLIALISVALFMVLLEGALILFGVKPVLRSDDPLVGFAGNLPLFVAKTAPDGRVKMVTAENKLRYFNAQEFPREKAPGTYRIFCLGGSTTFGRPYGDPTSFAGWLRELLPAADPTRRWEVINAGGISYASYRVARLMEELTQYHPDLFIVYSGQNEFLEERTYGSLRDLPAIVRSTSALLARTRTWAVMQSGLDRLGLLPGPQQESRTQLSGEVDTILDRSAGPERYHRDDELEKQVLTHYRISLARMVDIARAAGANILFVTPASNLKDCSPFKSQHTDGLDANLQRRSETLLARGKERLAAADWTGALAAIDEAVAIDPRFAEIHFRRGQALYPLGRYREAMEAFSRARDEDVCPLRALTPMRGIVADVARVKGAQLVDFVGLLEERSKAGNGHGLPGAEYFLDHVHPTITANRALAVSLVETLVGRGIVKPGKGWGEGAIAGVAARVEGRIDRKVHANALANLAKVLLWAGKLEDAERLALQAIELGGDEPKIVAKADKMLIVVARQRGETDKVREYALQGIEADPWDPKINYHYAVSLFRQQRMPEGTAYLFLADALGRTDATLSLLGLAMFEHERFDLAYPLLLEAQRLNPDDEVTDQALKELARIVSQPESEFPLPKISIVRYPSGVPREVLQVVTDAAGQEQRHGVYTEWHEKGGIKRYAEYVRGLPHGFDLRWDEGGRLVSQSVYRNGISTK